MMTPSTITPNDRLTAALFVAGVVHAAVIFGVDFSRPDQAEIKKSLEITLIRTSAQKAPEKADFLAQEHQQGGGRSEEKSKPQRNQIAQPEEAVRPEPPKPKPPPKPKAAEPKAVPLLTRKQSETSVAAAEKVEEIEEKPALDTTTLARQIAQLGAEISRSQDNSAGRSRIKYINSVNAQKYQAAAYEKAWQDKVERIGNLNYPDDARRQKLSGTLVLSVGLNNDGSIYSIQVRRSSGYPVLDAAAERIVRLGAPYAPFPDLLRQEADVLVITRTWEFTSDAQMSTQ